MAFIMDRVQLLPDCWATTRRHLVLTTKSPGISGTHLMSIGKIKG